MNAPYDGLYRVSQIYKGWKHKGVDLVGLSSKTIRATQSGIVQYAGWDDPRRKRYGMGVYIRIKGDDGLFYYFAHLSKLFIKQGDRVNLRDAIGVEGNTGHSFGSHLHYEIRKAVDNTTFIDPTKLIGIPNQLGVYEQEEEMTKDEVLAIVKEYLDGKNTKVSKWAEPSWNSMKQKGITDGNRPGGYATREEIITMLDRAIKLK